MAQTDYVAANKLHKQARTATINGAIATVLFTLGVGAFFAFDGNLIPGFVLIGAAAFFVFWSAPDAALSAGAMGEDRAMQVLTGLPDSFVLFNQLDIPNSKSRTGVNEADMVVCGPTAIFVVEVKNNNGTIVCDEASRQWQVVKVGRGGGVYAKEMRNPIAQAKQLVWLLGEHLKKTNSKPWIQGVVVFTNPDATLEFNGQTSVPVLRDSELNEFLLSFQGNSRPEVLARAREQLIILRKSQTASDA